MGDEDDGLVVKMLLDGMMEDVIRHVGIKSAKRVIQDVDVPITVEGTGQADSLSLPTAQVGPALPNLIKEKPP